MNRTLNFRVSEKGKPDFGFEAKTQLSSVDLITLFKNALKTEELLRSFDGGEKVELSRLDGSEAENGKAPICGWDKVEKRYRIKLFHPSRFRIKE